MSRQSVQSNTLSDNVEHSRISHSTHSVHAPLPFSQPTIQQQRYESELQSIVDNTIVNITGPRQKVYIGTRDSNLAMWQANHVHQLIEQYINTIQYSDMDHKRNTTATADYTAANHNHNLQPNPTLAHTSASPTEPTTLHVVGMKTLGDLSLAQPLSTFSNKGVFTKELDIALLNGTIDCAVHCMKDLPTTLPVGISIAATLERGTLEDAVIIHQKHISNNIHKLKDLPHGSIAGTSALRRIATLNKYYPHLIMHDVRGNVNTRLQKLDSGLYDALILSAAGLERIDLGDRISERLDASIYGHAVGQGALTILVRSDDRYMHSVLQPLNDIRTDLACTAERALLRTLQGGCKVPIIVHCLYNELQQSNTNDDSKYIELRLRGGVLSVDGHTTVENTLCCQLQYDIVTNNIIDNTINRTTAIDIGNQLGELLLSNGADVILNEIHAAQYTIDPQQKPNKST